MHKRIARARHLLGEEKADALFVWNSEGSGQPATAWLTGFTGSASALLITRKEIFLITDGRYAEQSRKETTGSTVHIASGGMLALVAATLREIGAHTILFDGWQTPYSAIEELRKQRSDVAFSARKRLLQSLRVVKDTAEIALLKKAAQIACRAFTRLIPDVTAGMTEASVASRLEALCREEGAEGQAFPTIVASGANGAHPHARASSKELRAGELVVIDFGVRYRGYVSDMTRTIAVGKISPRLRRAYEAVRTAQARACRDARAGKRGSELDMLCRSTLEKRKLGKFFTHATGHGIGMEIHELPVISREQDAELPAGAVITVEPGVYIPNVGGVRIEDALVLTKKGNINLSSGVTKELIVV